MGEDSGQTALRAGANSSPSKAARDRENPPRSSCWRDRLEAAKLRAIVTREPGGSPGAEIIRHLVLSGMGKLLGPEAETLLFAAARDDHVRTVIEPALTQGTWVLCDRFSDSTRAYQGRLGNVAPGVLNAMQRVTIGDLKPDLTIILDVPVEIGLKRAAAQPRRRRARPVRGGRHQVSSGPARCLPPDRGRRSRSLRADRRHRRAPTSSPRRSGPRCATICSRCATSASPA